MILMLLDNFEAEMIKMMAGTSDRFVPRYQIAYRSPKDKWTYGRMKTAEETLDWMETKLKLRCGYGYYITRNPRRKNAYGGWDLVAICHTVIDIDCHSDVSAALLNKAIDNVCGYLFASEGIPDPFAIVMTGRGVQVWWRWDTVSAIDPATGKPGKYAAVIDKITRCWCNEISDQLKATESCLRVDVPASTRHTGLVRLPGTINQHTKTPVTVTYLDPTQNLSLMEVYDNICGTSASTGSGHKHKRHNHPTNYDISGLAHFRLAALDQLMTLRNSYGYGWEGSRVNTCTVYYATARMIFSPDDAWAMTIDYNNRMDKPLSNRELEHGLSTARRRMHATHDTAYVSNAPIWYTTDRFIDCLNITESEAMAIGLQVSRSTGTNKNYARDTQRKQRRHNKRIETVSAYLTTHNYTKTSQITGLSIPTCRKYVEEYQVNMAEIHSASERLHNLISDSNIHLHSYYNSNKDNISEYSNDTVGSKRKNTGYIKAGEYYDTR